MFEAELPDQTLTGVFIANVGYLYAAEKSSE